MRGFKVRIGGKSRVRVFLTAAAFLSISGALVACGGGSSGSGGGGTTNAAGFGPGGQLSASDRECLQKNGLTLRGGPQGGTPPTGTTAGPPPGASGTSTNGGGPPGGVFIGPGGGSGPRQMPENARKAFQACGIQSPSSQTAGGGPNVDSSAFRQSVTGYVACIRQNGYDMPDPNLSGKGPVFDESKVNRDDPKFQSASQKCQQLLQPPAQGTSTSAQ
jgi:hypothetical protein